MQIVSFVYLGHMEMLPVPQDVRNVNVMDMVMKNEGYVMIPQGIVFVWTTQWDHTVISVCLGFLVIQSRFL